VAVVAPPPLGDGYDLQLVAQNRAHVPHVNHSAAQKVVDLAEAAQTTARANANEAHRLELAILALAQVTPEILAQRKRTAARKKQNEIDWRWMQRKGAKMGDGNEVVVIVYKTKGVYVGYAKRGKKGEVVRHGLGVLREVSVASPPLPPPSFLFHTRHSPPPLNSPLQSGVVHRGEFKDDEPHGYTTRYEHGKDKYGNTCSLYEGQWELNERAGHGVLVRYCA
jgi:hypothetical protein